MLSFKSLSGILCAGLLLFGCMSKQGIIERPNWAKEPIAWDYSGLTVSSFGKTEFVRNSHADAEQAEEEAMDNARRVIARQIAQSYLTATGDSLSLNDATRKVENVMGNFIETQSKYDEQRGIYFIQLFIPSSRVETIVFKAFQSALKVQANGELG